MIQQLWLRIPTTKNLRNVSEQWQNDRSQKAWNLNRRKIEISRSCACLKRLHFATEVHPYVHQACIGVSLSVLTSACPLITHIFTLLHKYDLKSSIHFQLYTRSSSRAVNTLRFAYENQSVNAVQCYNRCSFLRFTQKTRKFCVDHIYKY
jgi:hypothetical protein